MKLKIADLNETQLKDYLPFESLYFPGYNFIELFVFIARLHYFLMFCREFPECGSRYFHGFRRFLFLH